MPPSLYYATLAQSLAVNGSESEIFLSTIKTLTGETITTSQFATLGGVLTIDPLSSMNVELARFTTVDATNIGFTGITRGMSALNNTSVTANKKYHPAGTQVIISFGVHNLLDLQTYITGLISGSLGTATDVTAGSTKVTYNMGSLPRAKIALVSQSGSGATNLLVNPFSFEYLNGLYGNLPTTANPPVFSTVTTGAFSAPISNPRIDLVVWATSGGVPGTVAIRQGTEGASPATPTPNDGDIVLCTVFNRVGQTKIVERNDSTNGYIVQWYEPTIYSASIPLYTKQTNFGNDQTQGTTNATYAVGEANATTKHSIIGQKFVPTVNSIQGIRLWKIADTGTFTGTVKVSLQADTSGSPSGSDLASYTITNASWLGIPAASEFLVTFSTEYGSLVVGSSYWIVVSPSTSDNTNHPNLGSNTAGGYSSGALKFNNSTDGWVLTATTMLYFKTVCGIVSQIISTNTNGEVDPFVRPYSFVDMDATTTNVTNTTTETTVYTKWLPSKFFTLNSGLHVKIFATTPNASTNTLTLKVKYVGSTFATATGASPVTGNGVTQVTVNPEFFIVNNASLSAQRVFTSNLSLPVTAAASAATALSLNTVAVATTAIDTSVGGLLTITIQNSAADSTTVQYRGCIIEKIG